MIDIIKLEIQNLSNEEKESLYDKMRNEWPQRINPNENWEKFKDYQKLDKALKYYFWEHPLIFISFQSNYSKSLYNQTIKENNFAALSLEDVIKDLTFEQNEIVLWHILRKQSYLSRLESSRVFLEKINKKYIFEFEKLPKSEQMKMQIPYQKLYKGDELEQYNQNMFVLTEIPFETKKPLPKPAGRFTLPFLNYLDMDEKYLSSLKSKKTFFKNELQLILFALNNKNLGQELFHFHGKFLDPHYQVNQLIVKTREIEQLKKEILHLKCKDQKKCKH